MCKTLAAALLTFLAVSSLPATVSAQSLANHQAAPPAAPVTKPVSAIIPGTPLAALTGAPNPAPANAEANPPTPFGTDSLGLVGLTQAANEASASVGEFATAVRRSTELTPVLQWLQSFATDSTRRNQLANSCIGLLLTIFPALLVEAAVKLGLARPRAAIIRRALAGRVQEVPPEPDRLVKAGQGAEEKPPRKLSLRAIGRRLGLSLLYTLLTLLPILAFLLTVAALLASGIITSKATHLVVVGAGNAYVFWRITAEVLRFVYAPARPELRLLQTTDKRAAWMTKSLTRLVATAAFGYMIISFGEILGLSHTGGLVLIRLIALAVHIQLAMLVWQSRKIVAGWIRGRHPDSGIYIGIRNRIATVWHYLALFYILSLWVAWAGGVQNAFSVMLRVVAVFVGAMLLGRLLWLGMANLLEHTATSTGSARLTTFRARIRVYHPLVRLVLQGLTGSMVLVLMLEGWGFHVLPWLLKNPVSRIFVSALVSILITVALALLVWELGNALLDNRIDRLASAGKKRQAARLRTLLPMLKASLGVAVGLIAGLICLSKIGVNAAPLLAGAGVLGIAIGFGSQKLVQDIITGLFLLLEDAMQVGDVITLAGMSGTVERLSIRTIRLRGGDGSINIIPFSAVTTVTNQTRDFGYAQISIGVGYEEDLARVSAVLADISRTMRAEPAWGAMMRDDLQLNGLDAFGASALVITGQIRTGPGQHWAVRRQFYARVKRRFEEEGIEIPYTYLPPAPPPPPPPAPSQPAATQPPPAPAAGQDAALPASQHEHPLRLP